MGWLFWIWYAIGAALLLTIRVPEVLDFSNGLFLVFYALYALYLMKRHQVYWQLSDRSVTGGKSKPYVRLLLPAVIIWLGGMSLEWIGVHTGWPFGEYEYTPVLGSLIFGVPWTLGFGWIGVVAGGALLSSARVETGRQVPAAVRSWSARLLRAVKIGIWIIILDLVLDPVAHARGFWHWGGSGGFYGVPWSNFIAWFVVGGVLSLTLPILFITRKVHRQATFLYQGMLLLFGLLAWKAGIEGSMLAAALGILLAEGSYRYDTRA
ncbi:carotenoid biosynthesis protein [Paenibacillus wulumuqiensis]|uniref:carotenoid biosynthesis protein n=1 Tax=Paenibacillus wulumuqiensis TaxID=1567107 RepID=UPI0006194F8E|nr:carotenoid biosynthesis protein [Paenibacillus wulumuqiensis]